MYNPFQLQPKEDKRRFKPEDLLPYGNNFSEPGFWKKIASSAASIGRQFTEKALTLFYSLDDQMPNWGRPVIVGALGYFILPLDAIPDFFPGVGFMDDIAALATAFSAVGIYITPEAVEKAQEKVNQWFERAKTELENPQKGTIELEEKNAAEGHA